jgi:hypothetical protein
MTGLNIQWTVTKGGSFDPCARPGYQTTTEEIGTYEGKKFARYRIFEAYLDRKGVDYKITHQTIIPL